MIQDIDTLSLLERFRPETEAVIAHARSGSRPLDTTAIIVVLPECARYDEFLAQMTRSEHAMVLRRFDGGFVFPCDRSFARSSVLNMDGVKQDVVEYFSATPRDYVVVVFLGADVKLARTKARPGDRSLS